MSEKRTRYRLASATAVLALVLAGLFARLAFLHVGAGDDVRESLNKSRDLRRTFVAGRGSVYDRRGSDNILAMTLSVRDVGVDPCLATKRGEVDKAAQALAEFLGGDAEALRARMVASAEQGKQYIGLKRFVPEADLDALMHTNIASIVLDEGAIRHYPQGRFLCHVLGFANHAGLGSAGVELRMDEYLRGSPGWLESKKNADRDEILRYRRQYVPALPGANIVLTIDRNIQYIVEGVLDQVMQEHSAKGAWAIVQEIRTGEILAMASRPAFDLNGFGHSSESERLNRAIGCVYEPGSTLKPVVIAAAIEAGTVTPDTVLDCENGAWLYGGRLLRDHHPYGRLTVADGLKKSSNILTAKVALGLGAKRQYRALREFGFGQQLGIDLPGEERGILHKPSTWSKISPTRIAIGHGVAVTALQMLGMFCAIANDGFLMRPQIIRRVESPDGEVLWDSEPEVVSRPIRSETAAVMRHLLARVTERGGTGRRARVDGYGVAGKTGTAQKPIPGGYSSSAHVASFAGFLPASHPQIGVIVVVDDPQPVHTGGVVAAPAFSKIAGETVRYLGIPSMEVMVADGRK